MSSTNRNLYGFLSFVPFLSFLIYMGIFAMMFVNIFHHADEWQGDPSRFFPFEFFSSVVISGILMGVINLAVLIVFIIHAINNKTVNDTERIVWVLVFIFAGMVGFPIYWFMRGVHASTSSAVAPTT